MATIQKSAKINFYKFVAVKEPSSTAIKTEEGAALASNINRNTQAINNLGSVVNSLAGLLASLRTLAAKDLEAEEKNRTKFQANYTTTKKKEKKSSPKLGLQLQTPSFLEGLFNLLGGLFKIAVVTPVLKWISDKANQKKVTDIVNTISKVVKFIFDVAKFGVVNTIEGLYTLLSDESSPWEKIGGLVQGLTGLGTLLLGLRWLSNPTKIITDFGGVLKFLYNNLVRGKRGLLGRAGALGLVAGAAYGGFKLYQSLNDKEPTEQKSQGGSVKNLPSRSQGGFINGPQSGYKVSLDGGRSTSFIGHGSEYVARKANGGAFVIPLNTPGTKTQPHLTQKRIGEATSQGYKVPNAAKREYPTGKSLARSLGGKLPQFSQGGEYLSKVKANDGTSGDNANKKIFLHWSGGNRSGTNFYNGNGYHTYIDGSGQPVRRAKFGTRGTPYHTYGQNQATSAAIGVAGMAGFGSEGASSWGSQAITPGQYQGMAKEAAGIATAWGWKPSDITEQRVRTHYEDYRDHPEWYHRSNGSHYRWDLNRLYAGDPKDSGPNKIRKMIKNQMTSFGAKTTKTDDQTRDGSDGRKRAPWNPGLGVLDAVTGNMFDFDGAGKKTPPKTQTSSSSSSGGGEQRTGENGDQQPTSENAHGYGSLLDMIGRRESDSSGGYDAVNQIGKAGGHSTGNGYSGPFSKMSQHGGKKLTSMTVGEVMALQAPRSMSDAEWIKEGRLHATGRYQIIGPTLRSLVERGVVSKGDKYNAATQNKLGVALIKGRGRNANGLKNEWIGLQHETDGAILAAYDANGGKTKGGHNAGSGGITSTNSSTSSSSSDSATEKKPLTAAQKAFANSFNTGPASSAEGKTIGSGKGEVPASRFRSSGPNKTDLQKQTDERNNAREAINGRSQQMIQSVMTSVAMQNGVNSQAIQSANAAIQVAMNQTPQQPQLVGGSGTSSSGSVASKLMSTLNPLGRILK